MQPEPLPSLARREREKKLEPKAADVIQISRVAALEQKAVEPVVVEIKPRPRIAFLEVVRDDAGELIGLQPIYE